MRALALTIVVVALAGCATNPTPQAKDVRGTVQDRLAAAAEKAADAVRTLAEVEQAKLAVEGGGAGAAVAQPTFEVPAALAQEVTINWVGPLEPFVKKLADRAEYGFQPLGARPSVPIIVKVDSRKRRLLDILQDVGLQAGRRADVAVRFEPDGHGVVEVRYAAQP